MISYDLSAMVRRRSGTSLTLPAILPTRSMEIQYLRLLRQMLRAMAQEVRDRILPEAVTEIERAKAMRVDVEQSSFDALNRFGEAMANSILQNLTPVLGAEGRRHSAAFIQRAKSSLGVDLNQVVIEDDLRDLLTNVATRNAALIKGLSQDMVKRIQATVIASVLQGRSRSELQKILVQDFGFGNTRAELIAQDQTAKLNSDLNRFRHEQAGIEKYTWRTSHDERVRSRHRALDGHIYAYGEPTGAEQGLPPGQPIRCRCQALAIVEFGEPSVKVTKAKQPPKPSYGETTPLEAEFHEKGFTSAPDFIMGAIEKSPKVNVVIDNKAWPHANRNTTTISMQEGTKWGSRGDPQFGSFWRHEYGHHIDGSNAVKLGSPDVYISGQIHPELSKDARAAVAAKKKGLDPAYDVEGLASRSLDRIYDAPEGDRKLALLTEVRELLKDTIFDADDVLALNESWQTEKPSALQTLLIAARLRKGEWHNALLSMIRNADAFGKEVMGTVADYLGAATKNKVGWGHSTSYYGKFATARGSRGVTVGQTAEMFANFVTLQDANHQCQAALRMLKKMMPESTKAIETLLRKVAE